MFNFLSKIKIYKSKGFDLFEYSFVSILVGMVSITVLTTTGGNISDTLSNIGNGVVNLYHPTASGSSSLPENSGTTGDDPGTIADSGNTGDATTGDWGNPCTDLPPDQRPAECNAPPPPNCTIVLGRTICR
ncbi:MAG: hypothetical protein V2B14_00145 [bacterium]